MSGGATEERSGDVASCVFGRRFPREEVEITK